MANPEHLQMLGQGVEAWNQWRDQHRDITPDLHSADLHEADLGSGYPYRADLRGADLEEANLAGANLFKAILASAGEKGPRREARGKAGAGERRMASSEPWHTARRWAVVALWLACSVTAVSAQDGRWERVTAAGVQAFEQGDYAEAVRQFQAALPLADAGSLAPSLMNLAAVSYAQSQYTDAARLYQRALVLQEQILGPDDPQLIPVLEAHAAVHRKMHPVRSLLPWSPANQMAARVRRIQERALLSDLPWGPPSAHQPLGDGTGGE